MSRIKYQTIMTVKESPKATVVLADVAGMDEPVIIKHLYHANVEIFQELSTLNNPHIPKIYQVEKREDELVIAEEYVDGETLAVLLQRGMLGEEQKLELALQLCEAVEALHACHPPVIHRDIKPSNILVTKQGILKLIDFDASRQYKEESKNSDTMLLGTAEYAAPEQFGYSQTDVRSDIYSMGVVFNEMNLRKKKYAQKAWKRVVDTCTSFDPKNRYKNVTLLKQEIEKVKKGRKSFLVLWCGLVAAVVVFGAGIVWWTNREPAEGLTLTPTVTLELTKELSSTPSPVPSEAPSLTLSPVPLEAPSPTPSPVPSETPSSTPSPVPSEAPSPTPSPVLSEEPGQSLSPVPSEDPDLSPSPVPSEDPGMTPSPVPPEDPGMTPSSVPPEDPSPTTSSMPLEAPSPTPSPVSTEEPTLTMSPTPTPSSVPTVPPKVYQNVYWSDKVEYQMEKYQGLELCLPVEHKGKAVVYLCLADENDRFAEELVLLEEQWYQNLSDGSGIRLEEELFVQYGNQGALSLYVEFFDGMGERVQIIYGGET